MSSAAESSVLRMVALESEAAAIDSDDAPIAVTKEYLVQVLQEQRLILESSLAKVITSQLQSATAEIKSCQHAAILKIKSAIYTSSGIPSQHDNTLVSDEPPKACVRSPADSKGLTADDFDKRNIDCILQDAGFLDHPTDTGNIAWPNIRTVRCSNSNHSSSGLEVPSVEPALTRRHYSTQDSNHGTGEPCNLEKRATKLQPLQSCHERLQKQRVQENNSDLAHVECRRQRRSSSTPGNFLYEQALAASSVPQVSIVPNQVSDAEALIADHQFKTAVTANERELLDPLQDSAGVNSIISGNSRLQSAVLAQCDGMEDVLSQQSPSTAEWVQQVETKRTLNCVRVASEARTLASYSREQHKAQVHSDPDQFQHMHILCTLFRLLGIMRGNPKCVWAWFRRANYLVLALCVVALIYDLVQNPERIFHNSIQAAFAASSIASLIFIKPLPDCGYWGTSFLSRFAVHHKFLDKWARRSNLHLALAIFAVVCGTVSHVLHLRASEKDFSEGMIGRLLVSVYITTVYIALVYSVLQLLVFLELAVDAYSVELYKDTNYGRGICAWNILTSLMNKVAASTDTCFLALQTSLVISFLCFTAPILELVSSQPSDQQGQHSISILLQAPRLVIVSGPFMLLVKAVSISESCYRVPQVVNSLHVTSTNAMNHERQQLVNFITQTKAAFVVKGTHLNAMFLMNYCYLGGALICGIFTTALTLSQK